MRFQLLPTFSVSSSNLFRPLTQYRSGLRWALGLLVMVLTFSLPAAADVEGGDCIPEPTTDQVFAYGDILSGGNCVITPAGDLDIFQFAGSAGDKVRIILTRTGFGGLPCLELRDPDNILVVPVACNIVIHLDEMLTETGLYKIIVTESGNDNVFNYNLSLERLFPFREPRPVGFGEILTDGMISPASDVDTFSFNGEVGDEIRIILTRTGFSGLPCLELRDPLNVEVTAITCGVSIQLDPVLTVLGTYQLIVSEFGNDNTFNFNLSLQCLSGTCQEPPPFCNIEGSFLVDTLTLDFHLGTPVSAQWRFGLSSIVFDGAIFSSPIPPIEPPVAFSVPLAGFPSLGTIVVWTSFGTLDGITCIDFDLVDTGPIVPGAKLPSAEDMRSLMQRNYVPPPTP